MGAVVLLVFWGNMFTPGGETLADPLGFDFTYTADETVKVATVWDTVQFQSVLTNTGTEIDSYLVTLTENPPTPEEWWVRICAGGICWDSTVTTVNVYLEPTWSDNILLDIIPRTAEQGNFTITVESYGNPGVKLTKSITFLLSAHAEGPVTNGWGLIILSTLILASGFYLIYRKYRWAEGS